MATVGISQLAVLPMAADSSSSFWRRVPDAVHRRVRYGWSRWMVAPRPPLAAATLGWLKKFDRDMGVPRLASDPHPSVAVTATCAQALWAFGQRATVSRWLDWLLDRQLPGGAFATFGGENSSLTETAQVLRALVSLEAASPRVGEAVARGCDYLAGCIDASGRIHDKNDAAGGDQTPLVAHLTCLPPLLLAAQKHSNRVWEEGVWRALARFRRSVDLARWEAPSPWFAATLQSLCELHQQPLARQGLVLPSALQRRDGAVPALPGASWMSSEGLARLATVWFLLGDRAHGDRAMACLHARQSADGGFAASWGRGTSMPEHESIATAGQVLLAALAQVQAAFAATADSFETTIDARDGRVAAISEGLKGLPPGARVADVGCGKGRFLRALMPRFPQYRWTGIDVSPAMLAHMPAEAAARQGNLLNLSEPDGSYDAAFAVESLEHSLLPEQAVRELARIVRPGGRVIIIDKDRQRQPLSHCDPWEQWFSPDEVRDWLASDCESVDVVPIPHGPHAKPTGLFWCWTAELRATSRSKAA